MDGFQKIANELASELVPLYIAQLLHATGQYGERRRTPHPVGRGEWPEEGSRARWLVCWVTRTTVKAMPKLPCRTEHGVGQRPRTRAHPRLRVPSGTHPLPTRAVRRSTSAFRLRPEKTTNWRSTRPTAWRTANCNSATRPAPSKVQGRVAIDFDADIKEDAFFHYAKLSYELLNPLDDALVAFENSSTRSSLNVATKPTASC